MKKYVLALYLLVTSTVLAESELGCSISNILESSTPTLLKALKGSDCTEEIEVKKIMITEKLMSVKVLHENQEVVIERTAQNIKEICPPFCIEPMNIKNVVTVGEIEVLLFIDKLKAKKSRLLIDVRESEMYHKGSIPGAINLPFSMLNDEDKYQEKILKLLGGKILDSSVTSRWSFEEVHSLLIFGNSITSNEASNSIKRLLTLGYPSFKLLYYRAGLESWKSLGLTIK